MIRKIVIVGAGGFGREVQWLIERINQESVRWEIEGFIDDALEKGTMINGIPVIGSIEFLTKCGEALSVVCAIENPVTRNIVVRKLLKNPRLEFPNIIDPSVAYSEYVEMGKGNIICARTILTANIVMGDFNIINLNCTLGHDDMLRSYVTIYSGANISGNVKIGELTEIGTGTSVIQGKSIGRRVVTGAGAVVIRDIPPECTAVGVPAQIVKKLSGGCKNQLTNGCLYIVGAGGHGKVVAEIAESTGCYRKISFLDDDQRIKSCGDYQVVGTSDDIEKIEDEAEFFVAVGDCRIRGNFLKRLMQKKRCIPTFVHPDAMISPDAVLGEGTVVMAGVVINTNAKIGCGVILNTACSIDHDCRIGDFSHVAVGTHVSGNVSVGCRVWLGAGSTIKNNITIADDVLVGAGGVAVRNLEERGTYIGVPARKKQW